MERQREELAEIRERYLTVDTSVVADVLDELGYRDQGLSPQFQQYAREPVAGWAYTISGERAAYEGSGDASKMEACAGIGDGEVSVWAGDGEGECYFGELIALGMAERGSVGAVVDGGVRDLRWLREHGFPVFARYRTPIQSIGRWRVTEWQTDVSLRGATSPWVTVRPGDFVLGDDDGVIVVPAGLVDQVLERAEEIAATERQIRAALREGVSLAECLERYGHV